ncbi:MAG: PD-(D/E)XK nuclease family protein, partial [Oscillospiraceae bacterium]
YKNDKGETFIRVIDYKTGDKKFNLEEIYNGLNMQMLLYLFTFIDDKKIEDLNISEAGVIYLLSDPTPKMSVRGETGEAKEGYAVDGLIVSNDEIIDKMDKDRTGRFVPLTFSKNGECTQASIDKHLASLEKLGRIKVHVEKLVVQMAQELARGNIAAKPLKNGEKLPCNFCEYSSVCRHENGKNEGEIDRNVNFSQTETEDDFDLTKAEENFDLTEKKEVSENAKLD